MVTFKTIATNHKNYKLKMMVEVASFLLCQQSNDFPSIPKGKGYKKMSFVLTSLIENKSMQSLLFPYPIFLSSSQPFKDFFNQNIPNKNRFSLYMWVKIHNRTFRLYIINLQFLSIRNFIITYIYNLIKWTKPFDINLHLQYKYC